MDWREFEVQIYFTGRKTKADYDGSATDETGFVSDNKMYAFQTGLDIRQITRGSDLKIYYHNMTGIMQIVVI